MRKALLIAFLNLMMIGYVNAEGIKVPISILSEPNDDNGHIRHAPPKRKMPIVEIDNNYEVMAYTTKIINSFDSSKTVEEYFKELEAQTADVKQKEALNICGMVLDGLQYVDDNDTTYAETATKIIQNSSIDPEMKKTLLDGVSVANASAKLWNTEVLDTKLQK